MTGELRKFRTTTQGRTVEVVDEGTWRWQDAVVASGAEPPGALEPEGLFAEDLWDARCWAAAAVEDALAAEARDNEAYASTRGKKLQAAREEQLKPKGPELASCPAAGWQYVDPKGNVQGPFELAKMRLWHQCGYFAPSLPMRCSVEDEFRPFSEIFAKPLRPFENNVLRHKA